MMGGNIIFGIFGISGLIKSNIRSYITAGLAGESHEESLDHVLKTRYPFSEKNRKTVKKLHLTYFKTMKQIHPNFLFGVIDKEFEFKDEEFGEIRENKELVDLIGLLHAICFFETGVYQDEEFTAKIVKYLNKIAK